MSTTPPVPPSGPPPTSPIMSPRRDSRDSGISPTDLILIAQNTNNCARCDLFVRYNGLTDVVEVRTPGHYGGLKAFAYKQINPIAKMPALFSSDHSFVLFESQVILDFLADKFHHRLKHSFSCMTPELTAKVRMLIQIHDIYIASPNGKGEHFYANQHVLYKPSMPMEERTARMHELNEALDLLEAKMAHHDEGPYAVGHHLTLADFVLWPTYVWLGCLGPQDVDWLWKKRPRSAAWFKHCGMIPQFQQMATDLQHFAKKMPAAKVRQEMEAIGNGHHWVEEESPVHGRPEEFRVMSY
eukprot:TRINITY_DN13399_c0_g1_i1.p1 TRINITY_DN13399_c0_g1~~TRINITY_DN13399_c0_g1_i1.p1  ORF type:complete len:330 (+),score=58.80 TRINITY_DN13399_c0_g1_i1:98-991(+)